MKSLWIRASARIRRKPGFVIILVAIALSLVIFRNYLFGGELLYGDANFVWDRGLLNAELTSMLHVWRIQAGGFSGAIAAESQMIMIPQAIFSVFGIPLSTVLILVAIVVAAFAAFLRFARTLGASEYPAIVAAVFYVGNAWFWDQLIAGHVAICIATALAPVILNTAILHYRRVAGAAWLLFGLCAIELWIEPRTTLLVFGMLVAGAFVGAIRLFGRRQPWIGFAAAILLAPALAVLANGWWTVMYSLVKSGNLVPPFYPPIEAEATYSAFADLPHALVLSGYFLQFQWHRMWQLGAPAFLLWYTAMLFLLVVPAVFARSQFRNWAVALLIGGLVLSMGTHGVAVAPMYWIYEHLPLMALLREPVKFGFLVVVAIATLTALWMSHAGKMGRIVTCLAVGIAILPIFTGWLSTPDGHGLQVFSQRSEFLEILRFIRAHDPEGKYRVAVLPPWLADQRLAPEEYFTSNPMVIQNEISVIDAKLINTSSATDNAAWQTYYGLYRGTDSHPARSLANFGIRYVVVEDAAVLSPGGADTLFAHVSADAIHYLLAADRGFVPVYHSGAYWIYEDRFARDVFRRADLPLLAGPIAPALRQELPFGFGGDDVSHSSLEPLPAGTASLSTDALTTCVDLAAYSGIANAYSAVKKHEDYTAYWVASDYVLRGPDTLDSRVMAGFALPYAFTESTTNIDVTIDIKLAGTLYAQLATPRSRVDTRIWLDGKLLPKPIKVANRSLTWYSLGRTSAGRHVISVEGAASGLLVGRVAAVSNDCDHPMPAAQQQWFIPGPVTQARVRLNDRSASIYAGEDLQRVLDEKPPDGTVAMAIDRWPVLLGSPLTIFRGIHEVTFYRPSGALLDAAWAIANGGVEANDGTVVSAQRVFLKGGRWAQAASLTVKNIPPLQMTIVNLPVSGAPSTAKLRISTADGSVRTEINLSSLHDGFLLVPYLGDSYVIDVALPARDRGSLFVKDASVRAALRVGTPAFFKVPAAALRMRPVATQRTPLSIATLSLQPDGSLSRYDDGALQPFVATNSSSMNVRFRGVRASEPTRGTLRAYCTAPFRSQQEYALADISVGVAARDVDTVVSLPPGVTGVAFGFRPDKGHAVISLRDAVITALPSFADGFAVAAPGHRLMFGTSLPFIRKSAEEYRIAALPHAPIIGDFTYDVHWNATVQHWEADGFQNAWFGPPDKNVTVSYDVQPLFSILQFVFVLFLVATFGLWLLTGRVWRRGPRTGTIE